MARRSSSSGPERPRREASAAPPPGGESDGSSPGAERRAFDEACERAGVQAEHRASLWAVFASAAGSGPAQARIDWLVADYGHWQLFEASRAGDERAARRFHDHWRRYIGGFLGPRIGADAADEIIGMFFIRAYERVPQRFRWQCPFASYLRSIVVNLWRDEGERASSARRRELSLDDGDATEGRWLESVEPAPDEALASAEIVESVRAALLELEPSDRQVVIACLVRGESGQELAVELGLTRDALYQRLHRARKRLKQVFVERGRDASG